MIFSTNVEGKKSSLKTESVCFDPKPPRQCDQRPRMNFWALLKRQTKREKEPQKGLAGAAKALGLSLKVEK